MGWTKPKEASSWQEDFGRRVRAHRDSQGMSQLELALAADMDPTYLSDVEQGRRNIALVNINVLAATLGVSPRELFPDSVSQVTRGS